MPIYEYTCGSCGTEFEKLSLAGSDENGDSEGGGPEITCPSCGSESVSKRFSTFGVKTSHVPLGGAATGRAAGGGGCCGGFCGCN